MPFIGAAITGVSVLYVIYRLIDHDTENWWLSATKTENNKTK